MGEEVTITSNALHPSPTGNGTEDRAMTQTFPALAFHADWSFAVSICGTSLGRAVATGAKAQRGADFLHSERAQLCNSFSETILRYGYGIVQVHGADCFHAVFLG